MGVAVVFHRSFLGFMFRIYGIYGFRILPDFSRELRKGH